MKEMDINKWHERYKERLMSVVLLTKKEAQDSLEADLGNYNYNDVTEDIANDEMSYWTND